MMKSHFFLITYAIANLSLILYGALALSMPGILLKPFSENVYQFPEGALGAVTYVEGLFRLLGFFNLVLGTLGLLFIRRFKKSSEKWALKIVIASTLAAYIGPIIFDNTVGSIGFFEIVELVLFGLMLLAGAFMLRNGGAD
ncbi:hypothetical protein EG832_16190 [bacterium]|nr:hypothetical protein [bacterium]